MSVGPSVFLSVCSSFHVIILLLSTDVTRHVNKWWVYPSTGPRWYVWTTFFDALSNTAIEKYPIFYNWSKITRQGRCCFFYSIMHRLLFAFSTIAIVRWSLEHPSPPAVIFTISLCIMVRSIQSNQTTFPCHNPYFIQYQSDIYTKISANKSLQLKFIAFQIVHFFCHCYLAFLTINS